MEKDIYLSLVRCAVRCEAVAAECSVSDRNDEYYRKILVYLDCASMCRQVAMLYLRGTERAQILAKSCVHVCENCLFYSLSQQNEEETVEGTYIDAIQSCLSIINGPHQSGQTSGQIPASVFYGIEMNESMRC